ncbi:hypothetical protein L9F63_020283 [Diploptera punctata]|uniref:GTP-eEF1A C-terminal domain-containing protein n=1 Tax=Diploptera punctata TaxID=6984 RepID=A0AAD7ZSX7_DIPPU|nr:hypothetical protein L9F63_020283 [Diploptera punctata]
MVQVGDKVLVQPQNEGALIKALSIDDVSVQKCFSRIVVFNIKLPITKGYSVVLHHQSLVEQAVITKLVAQLHKSSGEVVKKRPRCLVRNSNAVVELETSRPVCMELYRDVKELGRFMLRVGGVTIAAGLVTQIF